jgi:pimeloyl-ACP methyl ester carboxylesterase
MEILEKNIVVQNINTHYYEAGSKGPVVVLLHGGGVDSAHLSWGGVLAPLAASGHRVIAPDLPGYGDSDCPSDAGSVSYYLNFFPKFMDALNLNDVTLVGISMGGSISIGTCLERPTRVERLVLVDSYGIQRKAPFHRLSYIMVKIPGLLESTWPMVRMNRSMARWSMKNVFHDTSAISDDLLDAILIEARRPNAGKAFTIMQRDEILTSGVKTTFLDRLHEIKVPTLIVHGEFDTAVPLECAKEAHQRIFRSKLEIIPGAGHWPQRERPDEFNSVVMEFVK